ncbi:Hypothetical predicted protein [Pelobates cultripes]|uniref:C-type lectin domain-containing protein n=1 Tax=Pelobates cultripes TaxID=61616 RepID=A0AAD1T6U0_PELCU|nr:Hypothetical predicted protein [Pelobates cultripes]
MCLCTVFMFSGVVRATCPPGWQGWSGHCYYIETGDRMSWTNAKAACTHYKDTRLLFINRPEEKVQDSQYIKDRLISVHVTAWISTLLTINAKSVLPLQSWVSTAIKENSWIGLNDIDKDGKWSWAGGEPADTSATWLIDLTSAPAGCAEISTDGKVTSQTNCAALRTWICERDEACLRVSRPSVSPILPCPPSFRVPCPSVSPILPCPLSLRVPHPSVSPVPPCPPSFHVPCPSVSPVPLCLLSLRVPCPSVPPIPLCPLSLCTSYPSVSPVPLCLLSLCVPRPSVSPVPLCLLALRVPCPSVPPIRLCQLSPSLRVTMAVDLFLEYPRHALLKPRANSDQLASLGSAKEACILGSESCTGVTQWEGAFVLVSGNQMVLSTLVPVTAYLRTACAPGYYGIKCANTCYACPQNLICNAVTGLCDSIVTCIGGLQLSGCQRAVSLECPQEPGWWFWEDHCYFISEKTETKSWNDAKDACTFYKGTSLLTINSQEEKEWVSSMISDQAWTGLSTTSRGLIWTWADGQTPTVSASWFSVTPLGYIKNTFCVVITPAPASLAAQECVLSYRWVCEQSVRTPFQPIPGMIILEPLPQSMAGYPVLRAAELGCLSNIPQCTGVTLWNALISTLCPGDRWRLWNKGCYYIETTTGKTAPDSSLFCERFRETNLLTVDTDTEKVSYRVQ